MTNENYLHNQIQSSRRRWLAAVLSHHRAYRSVRGGFNSWHALTDRLWPNHNIPSLSVFLLLVLFWPLLNLPFSNKLFNYRLLHWLPIPVFPDLSASVFESLAVSTVSRYTSVSFYTTIHLMLRCFSSCLPYYNNSAILAYILLFASWLSLYFRTCSGKWAFSLNVPSRYFVLLSKSLSDARSLLANNTISSA